MCCICRTVNCVRRRLFGSCNSNYGYNNSNCGCGNSRYSEPRTNVTCANQRSQCFEPCCDNENTRCHNHRHHDCGCDD